MKALGLLDCCLFPFSPEDWNSYNSKNYNMDDWNQKYRLWYTDPETYIENFVNRVRKGLTEGEVQICLLYTSSGAPERLCPPGALSGASAEQLGG